MRVKIELASKCRCTGCGVCVDVCPVDCIDYAPNGIHYYPVINRDACISCGKCMKTCPALNDIKVLGTSVSQRYYASWNTDANIVCSSTSGGIGVGLALHAIEQGYVVVGCVLKKNGNVEHVIVENKEGIEHFKGSKYVQSNSVGIFKECLSLLNRGKKIFFIGTPCQVEGLKHVLPHQFEESVLTCSIVCHGVNSPIVWNDYYQYLEKSNHSKLLAYNFRSKSKGWQKANGAPNLRVFMEFENGKKFDQPSWKNLFHCWFGQHYILRQSCLRCDYRTEERNSDIVIGDFWGVERVLPDIDTKNGVSVLIVTSTAGLKFVESNQHIFYQEVSAEKSKKVLRGFVNKKNEDTIIVEEKRNSEFEVEYIAIGFDAMRKKFPTETTIDHIKAFIKNKLHI